MLAPRYGDEALAEGHQNEPKKLADRWRSCRRGGLASAVIDANQAGLAITTALGPVH